MSNFILLVQNWTKPTPKYDPMEICKTENLTTFWLAHLSKHRSSKKNHTEFYDGEGGVDEVEKAGQNVQNLT